MIKKIIYEMIGYFKMCNGISFDYVCLVFACWILICGNWTLKGHQMNPPRPEGIKHIEHESSVRVHKMWE